MLFPDPASPEELARLDELIEGWLAAQLAENDAVDGVERIAGEHQWYVRLHGDEKATFGIVFELGQRTLRYETYLMPAPLENAAELYEHLLRRNLKLYGAAFAIGEEDALFLVGQLANAHVDEDELDRILGSLYEWVEAFFRPAMRIGYASRFTG